VAKKRLKIMVTDHALQRYRERINPDATLHDVRSHFCKTWDTVKDGVTFRFSKRRRNLTILTCMKVH
jgi:hypothetical protein